MTKSGLETFLFGKNDDDNSYKKVVGDTNREAIEN
jgi:hypothetical protein